MVDLNEENFDEIAGEYQAGYRKKHCSCIKFKTKKITIKKLTFVNFYMRWCMPCRSPDLWNAWEGLVDEMKKQNQPVVIARVDCMSAGNLCSKFQAWIKNSNFDSKSNRSNHQKK